MLKKIGKLFIAILLVAELIAFVLPLNKVQAAIDTTTFQQPSIVANSSYALFLTADGKVKSSGYGSSGELGLGSTTQASVPTEITGLTNVKQLAAGYNSSYALLKDGTVKSWGYNGYYGLGFGDTTNRTTPTLIPNLTNVKQIAAGQYFAAAVMNDGTVRSWGYNSYGQLGSGTTTNGTLPTKIPNLTNVSQISVGNNYMLALLNDGTVKAWGYNGNGQLGLGNTTNVSVPTPLPNLSNVRQLSAGYTHVLAVLNNGTLKSWGTNSYGELGIGTTVSSSSPVPIPSLTNISQVTAGNYFSLAVLNDGTTKSWGYNNYGQLGLGDTTNRTTPTSLTTENNVVNVSAGPNFAFFLKENNSVRAVGYNGNYQLGIADGSAKLTPVDIPGFQVMTVPLQIEAIDSANFIVSSSYSDSSYSYINGVLRAWGSNSSGQLGTGDTSDRTIPTTVVGLSGIKQLAVGDSYALALMEDGTVKGWGKNNYGQLGTGDSVNIKVPTTIQGLSGVKQLAAGASHTLALMEDGTVKSWGSNSSGQLGTGDTATGNTPTKIPSLSGVKQLAAGYYHTLALMEDGTAKSWGSNSSGQLGTGDTVNKTAPTTIPGLSGVKQLAVGSSHTLALMEDGTVKSWGYNSSGQLGTGDTVNKTAPTTIPGLSGVKQLGAGFSHTLALMEDGTVKSWGYNSSGQLGTGDTTNKTAPTTIPGLSGVKQLATGSSHALALMEDGTVKSWGYNFFGQLGMGDSLNKTSPTTILYLSGIKQLTAGSSHSLALMEDGTVKSWGSNDNGQLGTGDTVSKTVPTAISGLSGVKQLAASSSHTVALMVDGTVKSWGSNGSGQLGTGDTVSKTVPTTVPGLSGVKQLVTGSYFTLALMGDGTVKGWGDNSYGQLGTGDMTNKIIPTTIPSLSRVKQLVVGAYHTLALMEDGTVKSWGYNVHGQLGTGDLSTKTIPSTISGLSGVKQLSAGYFYTLALMADGTVRSWGYNSDGQLGTGNTMSKTVPTTISGLGGVKQLSAGFSHTMALMEDGTVKSWGFNFHGQLGAGDTTSKMMPTIIPSLSGVRQLSAGSYYTLALMEDGSLKGWGNNSSGQLGTISNRSTPTLINLNQQSIIPKLKIKGQSNAITSIKYFLDAETEPKATQNLKLSGNIDIFTFDTLNTDNLTKGIHTLRYEVSDGAQTAQAKMSFTINNAPLQNTFTTSSTTNSVTATVTSNDGGLDPDPYRITINNQTSNWNSTNTFTVNNLAPNKKYYVKFEMKDSAGNITTETRDVITLASDPVLTLSGTTPTTATFTVSDNNPANTQYQLSTGTSTVSTTGKLISGSAWITLTNKKITVNGLKSGKSYRFQIKARNQEGNETAPSVWVQVGPPAKPPTQPLNLKTSVTSNSVKLTWNPVQDATGYEIEINSDQIISNGTSLVYNPTSLDPNTIYTYRVRAVNDSVKGAWSQAVMVRTLLPAPIVPGNIIAIPTSKTVSLQWSDVIGALNYEVEWDGQLRKTSKTTEFKVGGLLPGSQHTYRVRAVNSGGISPWSQMYTIMTKSDVPSVPTELKAEAEDKKVRLNWKPVEDATFYEIEADGVVVINNSMSNATDIAGLEPGTTHQYRVRAVNEIGGGAWSDPISSTTFRLPTPTNITDNVQDTSVELTWSAVPSAIGYYIEADGQVSSVSGTTYKQTGLTAETTHIYRIRAQGGAGISGWSRLITLTTLPVKPLPPAHVNAIAGKDYVTVTWEAVPGALGYDLEIDGKVVVDNFEETTYRDILLDPFTPHTYRVRAKTDAVEGDWSKLVTLATLPDFPAAPQNIRLTSSGSIVTLAWDADPTAQGYEIEINGKIQDIGMHTSYQHRRIAKESEHKYRIRTHNAAGVGDWTGLIINNTVTAKLTKKETVDLGLTASDVTDFSRYTLMVNYDPNAMSVADLSILTGTPELTTGRITGTDIIVNSFTPGRIVFTTDKVVNPGESWTGVLNSIKFRASVSGGSSLTYTVIQKPETNFFKDPISYLKAMEF
ncbi:fibronectin type III domain-containing protein [Paenibacillus sp. YPG26]|uniref:RCC1 domain-containing protein n=1 Tax=Paenibacillus sp. YPG26 TaxID=2878915 RepID=UPI00203B2E98|nr:fibronectin type III domain-containing protein [Paenibacillus sp. YPG26]USB32580.1 fibronectin type III domain-containing protein [Paenibacillus sp. YPG26]